MPFCDKCGAKNPDEAKKCSNCGNSLEKDRRLGNMLIVIIAIIMVVATVLVLFVFG